MTVHDRTRLIGRLLFSAVVAGGFMGTRALAFYFDVISHNAYLAWHELPALAQRHGLQIDARPVVFGALLKAHGQLGPAEVPGKSAWMIRDVLRKATRLGIDINPPASHPFNPLLALRVITAQSERARRTQLIDTLFRAVWVEAKDVSDAHTLHAVLSAAGFDARTLLDAAGSDEVKGALRASTEQALARGVFGVPTMCIDDELFWGFDDFEPLDAYLGGEPPAGPEALAGWYAVKPSIQRTR